MPLQLSTINTTHIAMETFLIRLLQFMLSISILVVLHEGGHFFFARLFKVRVEKFYLFFNPWFSLLKWKPKNSHTTYGIGWVPMGGYVKIAGMIDESMDTEQMKQEPQPWEFRSKPAWQRLLIMIGGVLVNFLLALFIYSMVLYHWGESYVQTKDMSYGMKYNEEAQRLGFRDGDILLGSDKGEFTKFDVSLYRQLSTAKSVRVLRDGSVATIQLPGELNMLEMVKAQPPFVRPLIPAEIDSVVPGSIADKAHLQKGDKLLAFNGKPISTWNEYNNEIGILDDRLIAASSAADNASIRHITLALQHPDASTTDTVELTLDANLKMGIGQSNIYSYYKDSHFSYGFFESIPAGIGYGWGVLRGYVDDMKYVFTSDGAKSLGGFGAIGSLFPAEWDWMLFWQMTAFLSIILAFMNILPIPALDGGHVLFLLYEIITRRKPSEKFMIRAEYIGITILLLLMIVANLNDVLRWIGVM